MAVCPLLAHALLAVLPIQGSGQLAWGPDEDLWTIQDVIVPPVFRPGTEVTFRGVTRMQPYAPHGYLIGWSAWAPGVGGQSFLQFADTPERGLRPPVLANSISPETYGTCVLDAPSGPRLVCRAYQGSQAYLAVIDLQTSTPLLTLGSSAIPGYSQYRPTITVDSAGDVDGDGWDDALILYNSQGYGPAVGLLDGRTLTEAWIRTEQPLYVVGTVLPADGGPSPDHDGDGVGDFHYAGYRYNYSVPNNFTYVIRSGATGQVLLSRTHPQWVGGGGYLIDDLDGDGKREYCTLIYRDLGFPHRRPALFDGATGDLLWEQDAADLFEGVDLTRFGRPEFIAGPVPVRRPRTGALELACVIRAPSFSPPGSWQMRVLHLDVDDGSIRTVSDLPRETAGWTLPYGSFPLREGYWPTWLGDIDADGLGEFAFPCIATGWPSGSLESTSMVVVGRRTLLAPREARLGDRIQVQVGVPSAGGMSCRLVATTRLTPSGAVYGGWKTRLPVGDPLVSSTLADPRGLLPLDARGRASREWRVPSAGALAGRSIHLQGFILDASGTVRTQTTPAEIHLLP